ncbi:DUF1010 domain-containing protein [Acidovorax sp. 39-64-12]|uniref:DUF1010 domain-containing protein n=1 Tax=Acidovorax sp. 39-64-12 TaxID=1970313 RepID=UPI0025C09F44|nr:DUF1010 domain-containing protein [Acidovorax sp. 39-64-12]HQT19431.1 DUF1010 domain-containing protein [Acidovorax defluvii]HQT51550.1 DUF1010 domain-containing protein [Acidovorax defluvii]
MRRLQVFIAVPARGSSATSYRYRSAAPLPWRSAFSWAEPIHLQFRELPFGLRV